MERELSGRGRCIGRGRCRGRGDYTCRGGSTIGRGRIYREMEVYLERDQRRERLRTRADRGTRQLLLSEVVRGACGGRPHTGDRGPGDGLWSAKTMHKHALLCGGRLDMSVVHGAPLFAWVHPWQGLDEVLGQAMLVGRRLCCLSARRFGSQRRRRRFWPPGCEASPPVRAVRLLCKCCMAHHQSGRGATEQGGASQHCMTAQQWQYRAPVISSTWRARYCHFCAVILLAAPIPYFHASISCLAQWLVQNCRERRRGRCEEVGARKQGPLVRSC